MFGWQHKDNYYLTNSQDLLEQTIGQSTIVADYWLDCDGQTLPQISDFIVLEPNNLATSPIKDYLQSKDIKFFSMIAHNSEFGTGWQLCLE